MLPNKCLQCFRHFAVEMQMTGTNISDLLLCSCQHIFMTVLKCSLWTTGKLFK